MNYKHIYHAGSFADVLKHVVLIDLLHALKRKDKPFCYIDTHGGSGFYDLFSDLAKKTNVFTTGIEKVISYEHPPKLIKEYITLIHEINNKLTNSTFSSLRYYPGSPLIAKQILRPSDRMIACELHPEEYQSLRNLFSGNKQIAIHHTDGFLGLKAFLPPKENRGLILIDPPYENPDEFTRIAHALPSALKRFPSGTYAIWYPIKEKALVDRFYRTLRTTIDGEILIIELTIYPDIPNHLNGSGMAIINPPWQFDLALKDYLPWLWKSLTINNQGEFSAHLLK